MHTLTKIIRLFIDGVVDDASASIVDVRARSIGEVIGCRVSSSGLCTIQVASNIPMADIELRLIKHLTFDNYRAMFVFDAEAPHITRIEILLTGVHRLNHHYVSDRLYQGIQGLVSCRFMDIDDNDDSCIELKYDSRNLSRFELLSIMYSLGYSAQIDSNDTSLKSGIVVVQIRIEGMHCNSCVSNICATIGDLPGAIDIKLTFEEKIAVVTYDSRILSLAHIVTEIEKLGFKAAVSTDHYEIEPSPSSELNNNRNELRRKPPAITKKSDGIETCFIQVEGMTCTSCVDSIERNLSKVEGIHSVLVALLAQRAEVKYDPEYLLPSQIAGLIKDLGFRAQVVETATSGTDIIDVNGKTSEALKKLLSLQPLQGVLVKLDDRGKIIEEQVILAQLIQRGDLLKVVPGETIPTDGRIIDGTTTCDESLITGESMPVDKVVGAQVVGGTKNLVGSIIMQATHVGQETALKQIIKLVEDAQTSKAPIQELADKIAGVFVPFILVISFITWLIYVIIGYTAYDSLKKHSSYGESNMTHYSQSEIVFELAFRYSITVLSVACPCALGLATPTAVMVATGVGAASGILIKGGEPLELARKVRTVVFDKTGTITKGKPSVVDKQIFIDDHHLTLDRMLAIAATAESGSEHPLALAIRNECKQRFGTEQMGQCFDFKATWGYGLFARVTGIDCLIPQSDTLRSYTVLIGNREWMMRNNIHVNEYIDRTMSKYEHDGHTAVLVAIDDILVGIFVIADEIKPSAPLTIFALNSLGLDTILLTGDNIKTARAIAAKVGIKTVYAEVLPTQKERFINKLKEKMALEEKVAMVGDGINDSPALARADVGIAVGSGTDVAVEAASIVLIRDELFDVVTAIILSKKTIWRIWINFIFAIGYNAIAIPIAAGILVPANIHLKPWMASAAMALSSISVVLSSLLLRYFRKPQMRTYENSSFQQWCTTMSVDIEVHRGIENVVGNSRRTSPASSRSGTSSKLSQLLVGAVSKFVKQSFGDKNKSKPVTTMDDTIGLISIKT
ncbi:unnamed protein product [Rotaria sp. Silwood2]|nr:unnamed protein product [Rotaria sp. Silwood2]